MKKAPECMCEGGLSQLPNKKSKPPRKMAGGGMFIKGALSRLAKREATEPIKKGVANVAKEGAGDVASRSPKLSETDKLANKLRSVLVPVEGVNNSIYRLPEKGVKLPSGTRAVEKSRVNNEVVYPVYHGAREVFDEPLKPLSEAHNDVTAFIGERADPRPLLYATPEPSVADLHARGISDISKDPNLRVYVGKGFPILNMSDFYNYDLSDIYKSLDYKLRNKLLDVYGAKEYSFNKPRTSSFLENSLRRNPEMLQKGEFGSLYDDINKIREAHIGTLPKNYIQYMNDVVGFNKRGESIQKRLPQFMIGDPEEAIGSGMLIPLKGDYAHGGQVQKMAGGGKFLVGALGRIAKREASEPIKKGVTTVSKEGIGEVVPQVVTKVVKESPVKGGLSLHQQVSRALRRKLTPEEIESLDRAQAQGYDVAGWHAGHFDKDLPASFPESGENALFHIDLTPYGNQAEARTWMSQGSGNAKPRTIELVVARSGKSKNVSDLESNTLKSGAKSEYDSFVYPNSSEITGNTFYNPIEVYKDTSPALMEFINNYSRKRNTTFNPSIGISRPEDVRLWNAEFDPEKLGEVGYKKAAGGPVQKMAGGGGVIGTLSRIAKGLTGKTNIVKEGGGNWLAGSVEKPLARLKTPGNPEPLNNWVDKQLTRYVKNEMGTAKDPVRELAEKGTLHYEPAPLTTKERGVGFHRELAGETDKKAGKSELAKAWENKADLNIKRSRAGKVHKEFLKSNPWLSKIDPETPVHELGEFGDNPAEALGFPHLIDELRNATNPESGLPTHLLLKPESLSKLSVPQAIERVAKINEWRAANKAAAQQELANKASTIREYTENNPLGLRWVELKAAGKDEAAKKALQEQLKYEGDVMGHCVGGYCDEVMGGQTRIFSLRDAKGEPHTTIEVNPRGGSEDLGGVDGLLNQLSDIEYKQVVEALGGKDPYFHEGAYAAIQKVRPDIVPIPSIVQIKGKQNLAPKEEYLPYVQDFVRNSPVGKGWEEVGDFRNAGLRRSKDVWNKAEQDKIRGAGQEIADYLTAEDINRINKQVWPGDPAYSINLTNPEGMAHGGSVEQSSPAPWYNWNV